jgi:hypothetical protein
MFPIICSYAPCRERVHSKLENIKVLLASQFFQKMSIPPPRRKLEVNPTPLLDVLIHLLLSETNVSPLSLQTAKNFLCGGGVDLFWNKPIN